jgi:carbon starvation protein CstA
MSRRGSIDEGDLDPRRAGLSVLVVGITAGYVLVSGPVHGGNVIWTMFGAVVTAMAATVLWMVGHSAIQARRWGLAQRP